MGFFALLPIVGQVITSVTGIIDKLVPDKDLATKLKADLELEMAKQDFTLIESQLQKQAEVVIAEASGESWLQRNWRPILMLVIVAIVANNYIIVPYLSLFTDQVKVLDLPDKLWNLMTLGVSGYIVGRTTEKAISTWKAS